MADLWQTIEQAAVSLEISVRTVNRHINSGKLASRLNSGRREVLLPESGTMDASVDDAVATDIADEAIFGNETLKSAVRDALTRLNGLADEPAVAPIDFSTSADDDALAGAFEWEQMQVTRAERLGTHREPVEPKVAARQSVPVQPPTPPAAAEVTHAPTQTQDPEPAAETVNTPSQPEEPEVVYVNPPSAARPTDPGFNANTFLALVDNAADKADLAVAAYQTLARAADARVQASRRSARVAWSAAAVMALGMSVAVGWTVHRLTQSSMTAGTLQQEVSAKSATLDEVSKERESLRTEMMNVREKAARAEGKLEAATQIQARLEDEVKQARAAADKSDGQRATTKPSIFERLSSILTDK